MKKNIAIFIVVAIVLGAIITSVIGCSSRGSAVKGTAQHERYVSHQVTDESAPIVYMTTDISPDGLMAIYRALGLEATGNVAVKISTGEPGNKHFLAPALIKNLVQHVNGTIVECNTVYNGRRDTTAVHYQVAKDHGFTDIARVIIMDEAGEVSLPVIGGKHLKENLVGAGFSQFDFNIVLSHFKGHSMAGYGGAIKNLSIGYASRTGKSLIHSAGRSRTNPWIGVQDHFLESMAEAAKSVVDASEGRILYINVMNHLSIDCDCYGSPAKPSMADVGILASLDPVALDQACVDIVYGAEDGYALVWRIISQKGLMTIDHAEQIGLGSKVYRLRKI